MKKLLVIALIIMCIAQLQAQVRIGHEEACVTAERFIKQQDGSHVQALTLSEEIKSTKSWQTNLFVFSMQPQGFVIVSALNEVLAYSLNSTLPTSAELPDHITYWLDLYNQQIDYLIEYPERQRKPIKSQQSVEPLLTSIWGQGCYHNAFCPRDSLGPCQHVSAGCVAIAMAQIMYYHKQPIIGNGLMKYNCPPYGTLSANFGNTTYQWDDMIATVNQSNSAVAKLISHCGISVKMVYGADLSCSSITSAQDAFHRFFLYSYSTLSNRKDYTDEDWKMLIRQDIDNLYPVYYEGKSSMGAHAFVCDGYDRNGLFHFNFGWDGFADGYYTLDSPYGFSTLQSCIHNIIPLANFPIQSDSHGIIYVAPDGSGDGSSWENATSDLQSAIYNSHISEASIWIKEGTYFGELVNEYAYSLLGYCRLYGGFKGDEPYDYDLSLRDFEAHPSVLDGNHSQGVLSVQSVNRSVLIDGFTIQNGIALNGGGIIVKGQTQIKNCKFRFNHSSAKGGGLLQHSLSERVVIEDCEFFGNEAEIDGGGLYSSGDIECHRCRFQNNLSYKEGGGVHCNSNSGVSRFICCTFSNNTAKNGGGIAIRQGVTFLNCLINNNTAEVGGGCYFNADAKLFNCTIVKNEAQTDYGGVYVSPSSQPQNIRNCIVWGNVSPEENTQIGPPGTYSNCAVEDDVSEKDSNFKAEGNNDGEMPKFYVRFRNPNVAAGIAGQGGDWRLQSNSLCINRGESIPGQSATDLDGNPRCQHEKVDLGAYESNTAVNIIDAYFCEDDPYYYQDSLLSELGTFSFLYSGLPYDSLVVIQMQNPIVSFTEEICEVEIYDFFGTPLNMSGEYTTTIDCITYKLDLTVQPLNYISTEAEICEGETYTFLGETLHETGHYSVIKECNIYELDLIVNPLPVVAMEEEICEGKTYYFFGTYLHESGHYSKNYDCKTYELDLTVNPSPPLRCSNDTLIIYGDSVQLNASGADSYRWSTGETTESITVYPEEDKTYIVEGFSQNQCSKMASVTVWVKREGEKLVLFPNPAHEKVKINIPYIDNVAVFNLLGECIYQVNANREDIELDVSQFDTGIYIVKVKQLKNLYYEKLIVVH